MTRTNFNRLLMGALAVVIGSGAVAISLNESVSAQTDEVKAVTDVMTREALAVDSIRSGPTAKMSPSSKADTPITVGMITATPISLPN